MKIGTRFAASTLQIVLALVLSLGTLPGYSQLAPDGPELAANGLRHRLIASAPGQISNLSDIASADGRLILVWREVLLGGRQQIHIRAAGEQDASFPPAQNEILATLPETESIYTLRVAAYGANVYVLYSSGSAEGIATVSFRRSSDGGMTFAPAVTLRDASPYADLAVD